MFSTMVGSALHKVLPLLQPAHGKITRLRVYSVRLNALFRLAFAPAPPHGLTSPHTVTRWLILQKARHHGIPSPPGVLFTFPSRYSCTIGRLCVLSLTRWSSQIHADFHGSGATREISSEVAYISCTGLLPAVVRRSRTLPLCSHFVTLCWV
jgi:hypothetical protein